MSDFSTLYQNATYSFVPLSPLLNPGFSMMFQYGAQRKAESAAQKQQKQPSPRNKPQT